MKLPERDIPKSILFKLFVEYFFFCFPEAKPVSILFDEFFPYLAANPISDIVPEHCSNTGCEYRECEMFLTPESSYEDHYVHPWDCSPDDREWFDTSWGKCYEIVPFTESLDESTYPIYCCKYPLLADEWYDDECKSSNRQDDSYCLREEYEELFDMSHVEMISKRARRAREKGVVFGWICFDKRGGVERIWEI